MMQTLTINSTQLLLVGVKHETSFDFMIGKDNAIYYNHAERLPYCARIKLPKPKTNRYELLGTIQKSKGVVSTTIEDEVLKELVEKAEKGYKDHMRGHIALIIQPIYSLLSFLEYQGLTLQEGQKMAVIKVKK